MLSSNLSLCDKNIGTCFLFLLFVWKCDIVYLFPCSCLSWPNYNLKMFWQMILATLSLYFLLRLDGGHNMWHQLEKKMLHNYMARWISACLILYNIEHTNLIPDEALVCIFPCYWIKPTFTCLTVNIIQFWRLNELRV